MCIFFYVKYVFLTAGNCTPHSCKVYSSIHKEQGTIHGTLQNLFPTHDEHKKGADLRIVSMQKITKL